MDLKNKPDVILKNVFKLNFFKPGQREIINQILNGRDVFGIMPTGAGKSICFQIPALIADGLTIVITPLISLMKDQVNLLNKKGVAATFLNSSLTTGQCRKVLFDVIKKKYKILYVSPERLLIKSFIEVTSRIKVFMIVVDEAHCVSNWGKNFRSSYLKIANYVNSFKIKPVCAAFTATATKEVKEEIIRQLQLKNPFCISTGFKRNNLFFDVIEIEEKFKIEKLIEILKKNVNESVIVYCSTRKKVENVFAILKVNGFNVTTYHAGLSNVVRRRNQNSFVSDECNIMVATNAIGMGLNKPDVRKIIHFNMPKDLESYYQEAGRAGRDGKVACCVLLHSNYDVNLNKFFIESVENSNLSAFQLQLEKQRGYFCLKQIMQYCKTKVCYQKFILNYFGEKTGADCGFCGNCKKNNVEDITAAAIKIFTLIKERDDGLGIKEACDILRGVLKKLSEQEIQNLIRNLILKKYVKIVNLKFPVLKNCESANKVLKEPEISKITINKKQNELQLLNFFNLGEDVNIKMMRELKKLRKVESKKKRLPINLIFTDTEMKEIIIKKPTRPKELLQISNFDETKIKELGNDVITIVLKHFYLTTIK